MALITKEYIKLARREKIARLAFALELLLAFSLLTGIVFMLPAYLSLALSKNEVLRLRVATEEVLLRKNLEEAGEKSDALNKIVASFDASEARRRNILPVVMRIAENTPEEIDILLLKLEPEKSGVFRITLNGKSKTRDVFLKYVENLKKLEIAEAVNSPITNLLKETDVVFALDIKLKKTSYSYEN